MTTAKELEVELKQMDERFSVVDNPNRPGLSNIFFDGKNFDLPVVSTEFIKDEIDKQHIYSFPNGMSARLHSKPEIIGRIEHFLNNLEEIKKNYD